MEIPDVPVLKWKNMADFRLASVSSGVSVQPTLSLDRLTKVEKSRHSVGDEDIMLHRDSEGMQVVL